MAPSSLPDSVAVMGPYPASWLYESWVPSPGPITIILSVFCHYALACSMSYCLLPLTLDFSASFCLLPLCPGLLSVPLPSPINLQPSELLCLFLFTPGFHSTETPLSILPHVWLLFHGLSLWLFIHVVPAHYGCPPPKGILILSESICVFLLSQTWVSTSYYKCTQCLMGLTIPTEIFLTGTGELLKIPSDGRKFLPIIHS